MSDLLLNGSTLVSDRTHCEEGVEIIRKKEYSFCYRGNCSIASCETQSRCGVQKGKKAKEVLVK